jgi:hypothetical protein
MVFKIMGEFVEGFETSTGLACLSFRRRVRREHPIL